FADFKVLIHNKELLHFLIFTFFTQLTLMGHFTYFPILFKEIGGGETLYGVASFIGAASELLIFQKSDLIFKKFKLKTIFLVSTMAFSLRWFLVATFQVPSILLLSQLLHSLTYGLFYVTAVNYIAHIVKEEFRATGQNLYASTISISSVISSLLGGFIFDNLGSRTLYLLGCTITLVTGLIYYYRMTTREKALT
ncbi:MAG: MFS transporter, partial [Halanaerobiales bacterium]